MIENISMVVGAKNGGCSFVHITVYHTFLPLPFYNLVGL